MSTPEGPSGTAEPTVPSAAGRFGWQQWGGDEFNTSHLDTSKWRLYGGTGANGVGVRSPQSVWLHEGSLVITARGDVSGGLAWHAQPATTYGRWEFRARVEPGTGYAPAILLWPDSDNWPVDGEIDVMEIIAGDRQTNHTTVHYGADDQRDEGIVTGDFTQWHTYAVDWQPDSITVYLDGDQIYSTTNPAAIPHGPMHLAIQLDVGPQGTWIPAPDETTPDAVSLYVDWVRMYH
ncbi:family 16 glycosylhydrolase [Geodermatophilus sp. TF02-6]|uniref:glycoside hydrolase family 16 protein n=1 Tax=Geodermatophilus sp. TF02-6 TaxID=2250575 RepID=UPI0013150321|nr:glycoside hydrolase family 16 protein [Geodermatophilus sp. TF02-6]